MLSPAGHACEEAAGRARQPQCFPALGSLRAVRCRPLRSVPAHFLQQDQISGDVALKIKWLLLSGMSLENLSSRVGAGRGRRGLLGTAWGHHSFEDRNNPEAVLVLTPVVSALGGRRQEDRCKLEAILVYTVHPRPLWTGVKPCLQVGGWTEPELDSHAPTSKTCGCTHG